jgi:hypothetical protein
MRNAAAAEWVLSLVCESDQACSVTGDLLEQGSGRGALWFWFSILQITVLRLFEDLRSSWGRMLWLAVQGILESFMVGTLSCIIVFNAIVKVWGRYWPYWINSNTSYIPPWGFNALILADFTAVLLIVGWDLARRSGGRELASSIAVLCALGAIWVLRAPGASAHPALPPAYMKDFPLWLVALPIIAGAIFYRRRSSRQRLGAA